MPRHTISDPAEVADRIASALLKGGACYEPAYEPGDMTRYDIAILNTGTMGYVVALPNFGTSYWFHLGIDLLHEDYVTEKLKVGGSGKLTELLNLVGDRLKTRRVQAASEKAADQLRVDEALARTLAGNEVLHDAEARRRAADIAEVMAERGVDEESAIRILADRRGER